MSSIILKIDIGCNLRCPYCIEKVQNLKIFSEKDIENQLLRLPNILKNLNKPDSITFIGGEPGLWSYKLTGKLISIIDYVYGQDQHIQIDTNGLFMKKFPFLVNNKRFTFTYHITDPENYDLSKDTYIKLKNVTTAIVVTKDLQNNYELLKKYKDECNKVSFQPCMINYSYDTNNDLLINKYQFNFLNTTYFNINSLKTYIGENEICYNKMISIRPERIKLYNCCSCYEDSSIIINEKTDYSLINENYISLNQIAKKCKYCDQHFNEYILK